MNETTAKANSRGRRAGGIILFACVVIAICLFVLTNLGIIAVGIFMLLLVALIVIGIICIGIAIFAIPLYIMKDTKVEPGAYELDEIAEVNKRKDH